MLASFYHCYQCCDHTHRITILYKFLGPVCVGSHLGLQLWSEWKNQSCSQYWICNAIFPNLDTFVVARLVVWVLRPVLWKTYKYSPKLTLISPTFSFPHSHTLSLISSLFALCREEFKAFVCEFCLHRPSTISSLFTAISVSSFKASDLIFVVWSVLVFRVSHFL